MLNASKWKPLNYANKLQKEFISKRGYSMMAGAHLLKHGRNFFLYEIILYDILIIETNATSKN